MSLNEEVPDHNRLFKSFETKLEEASELRVDITRRANYNGMRRPGIYITPLFVRPGEQSTILTSEEIAAQVARRAGIDVKDVFTP